MSANLDYLGKYVEDRITGLRGTVTMVGCDLNGQWEAVVVPRVDANAKPGESQWFSIDRLVVLEEAAPVENQCQASEGVLLESEPTGRRFEVHSCGRSHHVVADEVLNEENSGLLEFISGGHVVASFREWSSYVCVPHF